MSAAATAAGYLYASGRLRGRAQRDEEGHTEQEKPKPAARPIRVDRPRREVRVAALPTPEQPQPKPRRTPTIQYRTRRWRPGEESSGE